MRMSFNDYLGYIIGIIGIIAIAVITLSLLFPTLF